MQSSSDGSTIGIRARRTLSMTGTPIKNYVPQAFWPLWWCLGNNSRLFPYGYRDKSSFEDDFASTSLNGQEVSRASGFSLHWPGQPEAALRCGKLQLQSEGAEIFFRRVELDELP